MLRHAIAPSARYTKAANDVVRHKRLNSDAKILVLYVQGLPGECASRPLGELAEKVGIRGRAYQKAKQQLVADGYVHEWRGQDGRGRWVTRQLISNEPLTAEQARALREHPAASPPPGVRIPTVGGPTGRGVGGYKPAEDNSDKTTSHPPSEAEPVAEAVAEAAGAEPVGGAPDPFLLAQAERVLLSLRHTRRELHLGVREARSLAVEAVKWLERGLSSADLRLALLAERPDGGVRSAVGFLRYRLVQKLPEDPMPGVSRPDAGRVRAVGVPIPAPSEPPPPYVPWRERFAGGAPA
ncbi:hypothetical protein F0344_20915 [Streptomyces finlayi]|uniref:Helix-turn-helix domain-containing protein n=1 Tax=Streptomyces finlayi TaxID=67296 RepID=A0A7G7BN40_9ACTN|nr:hypothetical protein [Streptomyces finlayi]QNE76755.1 hypothetical protein F0344_20915 [Streptomyces finlayi]